MFDEAPHIYHFNALGAEHERVFETPSDCEVCVSVAWSKEAYLAAGFANGIICIWHYETATPCLVFTPPESLSLANLGVRCLQWNHIEHYSVLISANASGSVSVWNVAMAQCVNVFSQYHAGAEITAMAVSDNGELLATGDAKALINIWMFMLDPRPDPVLSIRHSKSYVGSAKIE